MSIKWHIGVLALAIACFGTACTEMEDLLFETAQDTAFSSDAELLLSLKGAYAGLYPVTEHFYYLQEATTDEMMVPQRPGAYPDDSWQRLHTREYRAEDEVLQSAWQFLNDGIMACNQLLDRFSAHTPPGQYLEAMRAEVKAVRALFCWWALDTFGKLPAEAAAAIHAKVDTPAGLYQFCVDELNNNLYYLDKEVNASTYGRINFWAGKMLLAKLYLNAEVYTGSAAWNEAAETLQAIIDARQFSLEANYFHNFALNNNYSREIIFAIPFDENIAPGFNLNALTLMKRPSDLPAAGVCVPLAFYEAFEDGDIRKKGLLAAEAGFDYHSNIRDVDVPWGAGLRIGKYESEANFHMNNDLPVFRYADVLLMYAEAVWRINPTDNQAVSAFNQVRQRAGISAVSQLDEALLLAERGRELYAEMHRRTDLIRFDKYYKPENTSRNYQFPH
jgi:hypothetical protein